MDIKRAEAFSHWFGEKIQQHFIREAFLSFPATQETFAEIQRWMRSGFSTALRNGVWYVSLPQGEESRRRDDV